MATVITPNILEGSKIVTNIDTYNYTVTKAGMYTASIQLQEPAPSAVLISINQNGAEQARAPYPYSSVQTHEEVRVVMNCAVNDVIALIFTSTAAPDLGKNAFKAIINIHEGAQG